MHVLRARHAEIVIPAKVSEEVSSQTSPLKRFIKRFPHVVVTLTKQEETRYLGLLGQRGVDPGEAASIAIAENRRLPLVIIDGVPKRLATRLGIKCINWRDFVAGRE